MTGIARTLDAITLFVEDPQRSKAFYRRVFDVEPIFEDETSVAFGLDNFVLNLLVRSNGDELISPAAVAPAGAGAQAQLTIGVEDADAASAALVAQGIPLLNGPMDRPWGVRTAAFADPDGHVWEIAAAIAKQ